MDCRWNSPGDVYKRQCLVMWLCRFCLCVILIRFLGFGPMGVWIGMFADWTVRAVIFTWRFHSRRWLRYKAVSYTHLRSCIPCRCYDHSGSIRILRTGWYVSRPGTDVCLIAESILLYGSGRKNHRNSVLRAGRICGVNILHLGTGIHYRKLYGIIPHRA